MLILMPFLNFNLPYSTYLLHFFSTFVSFLKLLIISLVISWFLIIYLFLVLIISLLPMSSTYLNFVSGWGTFSSRIFRKSIWIFHVRNHVLFSHFPLTLTWLVVGLSWNSQFKITFVQTWKALLYIFWYLLLPDVILSKISW